MKKSVRKTVLIGILAAFMGSACSNVPQYYKGAISLPKNEVEVANFSHQINFSGEAGALSGADLAAIDNFLNAEGVGYGDQLVLDFAAGDGAWQAKMTAVNNFLKTRGLWVKFASQTGSVSDPGSAALVVNRYSVITPDCAALSRESFVPTEMWVNKTFGCVTAHNLGVMVANPQDLIEGLPDTIADTRGAVRALELYRENIGSAGNLGSFGSLLSGLFGS
ncbi:MAG: hypothetical protein IIA70_00905 [Proteobacteria bacterium]|nr:hypothetical protein [Pseudomonadota bacterium]MCH8321998.1 hypothetical protein [Pseudomonadota bacterium]